MLAAIILVGVGTGGGGSRARARCELGLLLFSVAVPALSGVGVWSQGAIAEALRVESKLVLFSLSVYTPSNSIFSPEGSSARARGSGAGAQCKAVHVLG